MQGAYTVTGMLTDEETVKLDEPLPISPMKVRVTVEPLRPTAQRTYHEVVREIRQRQGARKYRPPTPEEIDRYLRAERDSWGE